jgi:uncharacterized protein YndB with AHSA1/START domain
MNKSIKWCRVQIRISAIPAKYAKTQKAIIMADILHQLLIHSNPSKIYHALTDAKGLSHWWTRHVNAEPMVNSIAQFTFNHGNTVVRLKIVKLMPNRTVVWHCIAGFPEWEDTQISFDLEAIREGTLVHFSHRGWRRTTGSYPKFNFEWAKYLVSLRNYLEKGKGFPSR